MINASDPHLSDLFAQWLAGPPSFAKLSHNPVHILDKNLEVPLGKRSLIKGNLRGNRPKVRKRKGTTMDKQAFQISIPNAAPLRKQCICDKESFCSTGATFNKPLPTYFQRPLFCQKVSIASLMFKFRDLSPDCYLTTYGTVLYAVFV